MDITELADLSKKYLAGEASEEEISRLLQWYNAYDEQELTVHILAPEGETAALLEKRMRLRLQAAIFPTPHKEKMQVLTNRKWWSAAALLLVLLIAGGFYFRHYQGSRIVASNEQQPGKIIPGSDKATLVLADGREINLDSTSRGMVSLQGKTKIVKTARGQIIYHSQDVATAAVSYNILRTPRGGQYKITLPDGTQVWLNAASSITYPTTFNGTARKVSITGEAYFEVAANSNQPFYVMLDGMEVQVLGTHFNVNGYTDESTINTTLLEGAVLVKTGNNTQHLSPGQQTRVKRGSDKIEWVKHLDAASTIAWKNGYFSFKDADIPAVMRQLSRWYNIEVAYAGTIPEGTFTGEIGRNLTETQLLKVLSQTRILFKIEASNRIVILP